LSRDAVDRTMELGVSPEQQAEADRVLHGVVAPFVLLNPGAVRANKRWPAERFAAVADALAESHGLSAAVTGSPNEREVLEAVMRCAKAPIVSLAERGITLGSLKGVIKRAALMISNDTGPRHMAIALGTPVVSLFGPTDVRHTMIAGANERVLSAEPFLPEELVADDYAKACRIERISVGDVRAACAALLAAPASARA
jgi:ADP-heptose:LPS heptosyltransferase